jgi:hypothetical protein
MKASLSSQSIISSHYSYALGASFDVKSLEDRNRQDVVNYFTTFVEYRKPYFNMLVKWCPEKLYQLVHDAVVGSGKVTPKFVN